MEKIIRVCGVFFALFSASAHTFEPFQAGDGGWHMGAPVVGNIDSDSTLEIIVAYRNSNSVWLLDAYKPNGSRLPGFPFNGLNSPINVSPTLSDLDGDGRNEILFTHGSTIVALKGNGSVLWSSSVNPLSYKPDAGFQAITNGFYLSGLPDLQDTLPPTAEFFSEVSSPIVADLEGDGHNGVLTSWKIDPDRLTALQDYNPFINDTFGLTEWGQTGEVWSGGVIVSDAQTGEKKFIYHFHQLVEAGLALAQLDTDKALEVLVLNDADGVVAFDKSKPPGLFGKGMLHRKFCKNLRLLSGSYQRGVDVHAADIDGDGLDEVLVASSQIHPNWQPSETLLDDDGSILWREWIQPVEFENQHGWFNNAALIPVNPDGDNRVDVLGFTHGHEITFRSWDGVRLAPRPGWPKNFAPNVPTPPVVGDVDGDGSQEIVIGTYDPSRKPSSGHLYVYSLAGQQKYLVAVPGGLKHIPTIADVDNEGGVEVIYRALDGKMYLQHFGEGLASKLSWATHRGNERHDGNFGISLFPTGTPITTSKYNGYGQVTFGWNLPPGSNADSIKIFRADQPTGPFVEIASLSTSTSTYTDSARKFGVQHIYEVAAIYESDVVRSAPFALRADLNGNLVANGGFEQDDDSQWDKWFTGEIPWNNMTGSSIQPHSGRQSMEIKLNNHGNNSTVTQSSHYGIPEDYLPVQPGTLYSFGGFIRSQNISQNSEHWFEWDSSRTAENTNARPALPWPSYFTPSLKAGTGSTRWTYLNRVFEMPAGFPNVELRHRYKIASPGSGSVFLDDVFFRPLPPPGDSRWKKWITFGSEWRYLSTTPGEGWTHSDFDDSSWPKARAKFGQGGGLQNIVTEVPKNQPAHYFRKKFVVAAGNYEELLLSATCTDDYGGTVYPMKIWLNGEEIPGPIEAVTGEGNIVKHFDLSPYLHLFQPGTNCIAVMLNNTWQPSWDNVAFDISLSAIPSSTPTAANAIGRIITASRQENGTVQLQVHVDAPSIWRVESSDQTQPLQWETLGTVAFPEPGTNSVIDTGQNGRPLPAAVDTRLYRLVREF